MIGVPEFVTVMETTVLPAALESLRKCQTADDVGLWRKALCKDVYSK